MSNEVEKRVEYRQVFVSVERLQSNMNRALGRKVKMQIIVDADALRDLKDNLPSYFRIGRGGRIEVNETEIFDIEGF